METNITRMLMKVHERKNTQATVESLLTSYVTYLLAVFTKDLLKVFYLIVVENTSSLVTMV